ncbi:MAG: hypothetical protein LC774_17135, partial [Acidobacteria bacterium]|nr:hypothetical protein [Acidobacteriota bacterium]
MKKTPSRRAALLTTSAAVALTLAFAQHFGATGGAFVRATSAQSQSPAQRQSVLERDVRAHLEFLASDAMQGRGSG